MKVAVCSCGKVVAVWDFKVWIQWRRLQDIQMMAASIWADGGKAPVGGWIMTATVHLKAFSPLWLSVSIGCLPLSWQPWLQQWEDDQQVAVGVGEDLLQLGLHCPVRVDPCGSAGPGQQRFWLKHRLLGLCYACFNSVALFPSSWRFPHW